MQEIFANVKQHKDVTPVLLVKNITNEAIGNIHNL